MKKQSKKNNKLFSAKGPLFIIACVVMVIMAAIFGFWIAMKIKLNPNVILGPIDNNPTTSGKVVVQEAQDNEPMKIWKEDESGNRIDDFKLITVSDFHLNDSTNNDAFVFDVLDQIIKKEQPDLVILLGDNIVNVYNNVWQEKLVNFFKERNQYWTFVLGNHDGQGWEGRGYEYWDSRKEAFNTLSGIFSESALPAEHCLARSCVFDPNKPETYGYGTNFIEVLGSNNKILNSLFFFDCEAIMEKNDAFVDWFKTQIEKTRQQGKLPEIFTFSHIPFIEMQEAWDKKDNTPDVKFNFGIKQEPICYDTNEKSGLFDVLVENAKETKATSVFGHDHVNNFSLTYKGVTLMYSLGLQYNTYNTRTDGGVAAYVIASYIVDNTICGFLDGATSYQIQVNQNTTISNRYNQLTGALDSIQDILWNKTRLLTYKNALPITIIIRISTILLTAGSFTYFGFFIHNKVINKAKTQKKDK